MKSKIFIAAPLFNPQQHAILDSIEQLLSENFYTFYSARHDSEPYLPKREDRGRHEAWVPVFQNNVQGLNSCQLMIAVVDYALPEDNCVALCGGDNSHDQVYQMRPIKRLELPDTGTVWEMGYFKGQRKVVVGFSPEKSGDHLNVMLSHGCDGMITGFHNLSKFLATGPFDGKKSLDECFPSSLRNAMSRMTPDEYSVICNFNWEVCEQVGAQVGGVEDAGQAATHHPV